MKKIFEPVVLNNMTLNNRLIRSATWEGIANPDGSMRDEAFEIYKELVQGGIGAIITGFTSVDLNDHYFESMMRLSDDSLIPQYKKLVDLIHNENIPVITQLALGAYYRNVNGQYIQIEPNDMTEEEIQQVIQQFIDAAVRAQKAGFDEVQIHSAHFFFLSRFISPAINHRTDKYGGSTENRFRIILEILEGIRKETDNLHISIKINSNDFTSDGINEEECLIMCMLLDQAGIDSIEISGNGTSVGGIKAHINEGYFVPAAAKVVDNVSCPVIVVGGFRSKDTMESILNNTNIDLISLSRLLLREPDLPKKLQTDSSVISKCISCNLCYSSPFHRWVFRTN